MWSLTCPGHFRLSLLDGGQNVARTKMILLSLRR